MLALDLRSLALMRIGLGVTMWLHLVKLGSSLADLYSDAGVLPRALASRVFEQPAYARLLFLDGSTAWAGLCFALTALSAACVVVGYRTRWALALCWLLFSSIAWRNPVVLHTGDSYLLVILLWSAFLPMDRRWAIGRPAAVDDDSTVQSVGTLALLAQVFVFYLLAGLTKAHYRAWTEGHAFGIFLHVDSYVRPLASSLAEVPGLSPAVTYLTLVLECGAPLLLWFPTRNGRGRLLFIAVMGSMHLVLQALIHIGAFQLLCLVVLSGLLPSRAWHSRAGRSCGRLLDGAWARAAATPGARTPRSGSGAALGRGGELLCAGLLLVAATSALHQGLSTDAAWSGRVDAFAQKLSLQQRWDMFSDVQHLDTGWFMRIGQLADGSRVDLDTGRPVMRPTITPRPADYAESFPSHAWRKYWGNISRAAYAPLLPRLGAYLCAHWSGSPLKAVGIFHVAEPVQEDFSIGAPRARTLLLQDCR